MRLIDVDEIKLPHGYFEKVDNVPKFYEWLSTLPTVDIDNLNAKHEDIGYEKGYRDGYAEALEVTDNTEHIRHGHWEWNDYGGFGNYHCTVCKYIPYGKFSRKFHSEMFAQVLYPDYMYCPRCGAKMDNAWEEPEINPCRGCADYDGQGGGKSNGGCGAERREDGNSN